MNIKPIVQIVNARWEHGFENVPLYALIDSGPVRNGLIINVIDDETIAQQAREDLELAGEELIVVKFEVVSRRTQA